ncbi:MAG: zinc-dependent dehydrogenase [Candidatus Bathyarchaeia archaeon]
MLAMVFHSPGDLRLEPVPKPQVDAGSALVRVEAAAVCASDIRIYKGEKAAEAGTILGHELAGLVAENGPDVSAVQVGDRVTMYPVIACGRCFYCQHGYRNMCLDRRTVGYEYDGGFAEYMLVTREALELGNLVKVPSGVSAEEAALTEPLACCINGLQVLGLEPGETLVVVGAGPMGLMLTRLAKASGAGQIIVSEPNERRLEVAGQMGADVKVNPSREDLAAKVKEVTDGLGADAAIVTVGVPSVAWETLKAVRRMGRVNLFAGFPRGSEAKVDLNLIHYGMTTATASQSATLTQFRRALTLMATGKVDVKPLITHRFPLSQGPQAFEKKIALEGLKPEILPGLG